MIRKRKKIMSHETRTTMTLEIEGTIFDILLDQKLGLDIVTYGVRQSISTALNGRNIEVHEVLFEDMQRVKVDLMKIVESHGFTIKDEY